MESSNKKVREFLLSWLTSCSNKFEGKFTSFGFTIPIVTIGADYEITLSDAVFSYTALTSDTSNDVLNELKILIDNTNIYQTSLVAEKLVISLTNQDYFYVSVSNNINVTNENGVTVIEAFNNTGTEINEVLSNMKPEEFPFLTFKISNQTNVAEDVVWGDGDDKYTTHKRILIDINFYKPVDYMDLAEYVMTGLCFENNVLKRTDLCIGVVGPSSPILNISDILGGRSEGRANTTLNLSVATTFYDTGISGIINVDPIENVIIEATEVSDTETHNNTIIINKEL